MVFSSSIFLFIFLPISVIGYYLLDHKFRNIFLLIISLLFYAWGEPRFVFILMGSVLMNYLFAIIVERYLEHRRFVKIVLAVMVLFNVAIFFVFKYLTFVLSNISYFMNIPVTIPTIALPIGISFFTFQAMSYVFDVYRGKGNAQKNPLDVGLYIAFFPQLIAGPIVRYETIAIEIKDRHENWTEFTLGMTRFISGLAKKVILANSLAAVADRYYNITDFAQLSVEGAWIGSICYSLQILFDFAGYSEMAIGLGLMFGFHFPENFNYPYISQSVSEFWRRWHMTLSTWFRDYVYIPLGGSRVSKVRLIFNLFVVWLLTGIWHGASWNFICWGLFYFILLVFEKMTRIPNRFKFRGTKFIYRIFTLICVNFGWVLFRAENLSKAKLFIKSMFGLNGNAIFDLQSTFIIKDYSVILVLAVLCCMPVSQFIQTSVAGKEKMVKFFQIFRGILLILLMIVSISYCVNGTYNPFIYFNF